MGNVTTSITIHIPAYLQTFTNDQESVEVKGSTLGECLNYLIQQFPPMAKMLWTKDGQLHSYVSIYLNGEDTYPEELTKPVKAGDTLHIVYIIGGG